MNYEELEKVINDKETMCKAFHYICAYCFKNMQIDCEGCPVVEMENMVRGE